MSISSATARSYLIGACLAVLIGWMVGIGQSGLLWVMAAAILVLLFIYRKPLVGVVVPLVICASIPLFHGLVAFNIGPLDVHWTDLALFALAVGAAASYLSDEACSTNLAVRGLVLVSPFLLTVTARAMLSVVDGAAISTVGTSLRVYVWYLAIVLFALTMASPRRRERTLSLVLGLGGLASILVILSNAVPALGLMLAAATGSRLIAIPGIDSSITRIVIPGMTLVPLAMGIVLGRLIYGSKTPIIYNAMLLTLYSAALLATFARGMWLWTLVAIALVMSVRVKMRTFVVVFTSIALLGVVLGVLDAAIGGSRALPDGLSGMVAARLGSIAAGDSNIEVRRSEDRAVLGSAKGREVLGVGLLEPIGVFMGEFNNAPLYTVHNSYYLIYGRFGLLGLLGLLWLVGGVAIVGVVTLRHASTAHAGALLGLCIGFVRGLLSSWTQQDITNLTGIIVLALCAGGIVAISADSGDPE